MRIISIIACLFLSLNLFATNNEYIVEADDNFIQLHNNNLSVFANSITTGKNTFVTVLSQDEVSNLKATPGVVRVAKNIKLDLFEAPDDLTKKLWGLKNPSKANEGFDINVLPAWEITTGSEDIIVAVIDTGAYIDHDDLMDNLWTNTAEMGGVTGVDDDGNGYIDDVFGFDFPKNTGILGDRVGHGTHVSGTIGAQGNNDTGIVGVNWDVSIMTLNMFPDKGQATLDDALKAIDYAVKNGAHVINASWGGPAPDPNDEEEVEAYQMLKDSIQAAGDAGVIFVAAAGNSGRNSDTTPLFPAAFDLDSIVSVGSMTSSGRRSFFSNYGLDSVDVFAPGSNITSTTKNGRTGSMSGTSMASPHVAGIAALLLSAVPDATIAEIKEALISTCAPNNSLTSRCVCKGHVDTHAALLKLKGDEKEEETPEEEEEQEEIPQDPENPTFS